MNSKKILAVLFLGIIILTTFAILPVFGAEARITEATYSGYVRDRNGQAIPYATVRLYSNGYQVSTDYTDYNGYYCVGDFAVSSPYLKVEKTKWVTKTQSVSYRGGTYNFNLYTSACALIVAGSSEQHFNNDAYLMHNTLIDHYSFSASRIYLITCLAFFDGARDRETSQSNVEWACDQIDALTGSNDDVLVFWASHGIKHKGLWPLWSTYYTLDCDDDEMTRSELDSVLDGIPCNRMLVMIDSCFSGYFIGGGMDDNANRAILTGCRSTEFGSALYIGITGHGCFSYGILRALDPDLYAANADEDSNNRVSVLEFFNYAYYYVTSITSNQTPQSWGGSSFGSFRYNYIGDQYY